VATSRLEAWKRQLAALSARLRRDQRCGRCGAPEGERGVLVVQLDALNALPRDGAGNLVELVRCPGCLQVPAVLLPANGR
jgi:hypothetical protein